MRLKGVTTVQENVVAFAWNLLEPIDNTMRLLAKNMLLDLDGVIINEPLIVISTPQIWDLLTKFTVETTRNFR